MWTAAQKKTRCKVWYKVKTKHIPLCQVLSWSKCTPHCKAGEPWRTVWKTSNGLRSTPRGTFLWKRRWTERCEPCFPRKFLYNPSYKISKKLHFHETPWNIGYAIAIKFRFQEMLGRESGNPDYAVIESTRASFRLDKFFLDKHASFSTSGLVKEKLSIFPTHMHEQLKLVMENLLLRTTLVMTENILCLCCRLRAIWWS